MSCLSIFMLQITCTILHTVSLPKLGAVVPPYLDICKGMAYTLEKPHCVWNMIHDPLRSTAITNYISHIWPWARMINKEATLTWLTLLIRKRVKCANSIVVWGELPLHLWCVWVYVKEIEIWHNPAFVQIYYDNLFQLAFLLYLLSTCKNRRLDNV